MILNYAQECYYLENKVGVVDYTKARGLVKFQSPRIGKISKAAGPAGPLGFKTLPFLGRLQNLLLPLYFRGNVSLLFYILEKLIISMDKILMQEVVSKKDCSVS